VKGTGYPLRSPVSPSLPHPCVTVCHHISSGFYQPFHISSSFYITCSLSVRRSTLGSSVLPMYTARFNTKNSTFCPHSVVVCSYNKQPLFRYAAVTRSGMVDGPRALQDEGDTCLRNVDAHLPCNAVPHPRRLESTTVLAMSVASCYTRQHRNLANTTCLS